MSLSDRTKEKERRLHGICSRQAVKVVASEQNVIVHKQQSSKFD